MYLLRNSTTTRRRDVSFNGLFAAKVLWSSADFVPKRAALSVFVIEIKAKVSEGEEQ